MNLTISASQNFKGYYKDKYYPDYVIDWAKKYRFATNYESALRQEVKSFHFFDEYIKEDYDQTQALIDIMKADDEASNQRIKDLDGDISEEAKKIDKINVRNTARQAELNKIQIENAIKRMTLSGAIESNSRVNEAMSRLREAVFSKIELEKNGVKDVIFENGYIIQGLSDDEQMRVCQNIKDRKIPVIIIDFNKIATQSDAQRAINAAKNELRENKIHGILAFKNFRKFMSGAKENFKLRNDFKNYFQCSARNFKIINLVFEDDKTKIDETIRSGQRFVDPPIDVRNVDNKSVLKGIKANIAEQIQKTLKMEPSEIQKKVKKVEEELNEKIFYPLQKGVNFRKDSGFADGYVIKGLSKSEQQYIFYSIMTREDEIIECIDFANFKKPKEAIKAIETVKNKMKNSKKPGILLFRNFDRCNINQDKDFGALYRYMQKLLSSAKEQKIINLFIANDVPKAKIPDNEIIVSVNPLRELKTTDNPFKTNARFFKINCGINYRYDKSPRDSVNLYLGDCGKNKNILWVDTGNAKKVNIVMKSIELIKQLPIFREVKKVQCPKSEEGTLPKGFRKLIFRKTANGQRIFEKTL